MSGEQRLNRVYPALSARERGLLVLKAYKAGEKPDPQIYHSTPDAQAHAFNRYVHLMNACNVELATVLAIMREQMDKAELKYSWLMTALIWGLETQVLGRHALAATKDRKLRKDIRRLMARAPSDLRVPIDPTVPPEEPATFKKGYGDATVHALLFGINQSLQQHWRELRAIEIVVQEVAEEFGGEDPLQPDTREMIDECLRSCTKIRDDVKVYIEIELAEPRDDDVAQVRLFIEKVTDG
jgi:hypothetical protein